MTGLLTPAAAPRRGVASRRRPATAARLSLLGLLLLLLTGLLGGCAGATRSTRTRALGDFSYSLQQTYRWKDFDALAKMLDPSLLPAFEQRLVAPGDELVITDTELGSVEVTEAEVDEAVVVLTVRWYRLPSVNETSTRVRCSLRWSKDHWVIVRQEEPGREGAGPLDLLPAAPAAAAPAAG